MGGGGGARRDGDHERRALRQSLLPDLPHRRRPDPRDQGISGLDALRTGAGRISAGKKARRRLIMPSRTCAMVARSNGRKTMTKEIFNPPSLMKPAGYSHVAKVSGGT